MQIVDLFIFDLDGTLVDTRQDIANAVNYVLKHAGQPLLPVQMVIQNVGDGVKKLLERSVTDFEHFNLEKAVSLFREYYCQHLLDFSHLYPGVIDLLSFYQEKKLAVVSNKPEQFTRDILTGLKIADKFTHILGGDSTPSLKPSPEPLNLVLDRTGTFPEKALMIGDSPSDLAAGRAANMLTCAVTFGFRSRDLLVAAKPDFIIDSYAELMQLAV